LVPGCLATPPRSGVSPRAVGPSGRRAGREAAARPAWWRRTWPGRPGQRRRRLIRRQRVRPVQIKPSRGRARGPLVPDLYGLGVSGPLARHRRRRGAAARRDGKPSPATYTSAAPPARRSSAMPAASPAACGSGRTLQNPVDGAGVHRTASRPTGNQLLPAPRAEIRTSPPLGPDVVPA
jgi:hypothetical protein